MTTSYFKSQVARLRNKTKLLSMFKLTNALPSHELVLELNKIEEELLQLEVDYNKKDYSTPKIAHLIKN